MLEVSYDFELAKREELDYFSHAMNSEVIVGFACFKVFPCAYARHTF